MSPDVIATILTGVAVLLGVWRIVDAGNRELRREIRVR